MKWVKFNERKPLLTGWYYYKGKDYYGGYTFFSVEDGCFYFEENIPRNKVDVDYLEWLNETNDENIQNAQD